MKYDKSVFCDSQGKKVVVGLFEEFDRPDRKFRPPFKLSDWKEVFIQSHDPSEYDAAMKLVGDWEHWQLIRNHPFISPYVDNWHKEMEVMLRSEAIKLMHQHARQQGGTAAAKWLADKGYATDVVKRGRGRPKHKEEQPEREEDVHEDMARLGLRAVK